MPIDTDDMNDRVLQGLAAEESSLRVNETQQKEIDEITNTSFSTRRPTVVSLEQIIGKVIPVLDKGFIRVIDYLGDDGAIVQAARVSYGKGTKRVSEDKGLIEYLIRHRHTTPLEQLCIKFHVKCPIFVMRQWIRHRMSSTNEYSARYSILTDEFYIPDLKHIAPQSSTNRQGRSIDQLNPSEGIIAQKNILDSSQRSYAQYEFLLNEDETGPITGIARELARMVLPLNIYTEFYWRLDLHNLFHFLSLRKDSHAQYEIRAYADVIGDIVAKWVPYAWEAWNNCVFESTHLTRKQWQIVKSLLDPKILAKLSFDEWKDQNGISKREFSELTDRINNAL